ncbi:hypothetical protein [Nitrospirillum viridazoti]|uniref:hypothetical protein n=1 Tax=Nitrospirillum viridazoti TaxID=3144925 RepID=UPI00110FC8AE|nr:hypothetical protein [Nitrospirillum amazonense]
MHIDVLAKATGLSNRTAVGAVGHLVKTGYLQPVEGKLILSDNPNTSRWIGWFAPTSQLGQWLVSNSIVPSDIVSGLFPHTAGWQDEHIDAFATEDSMDPYKVFQWGKTALQPDDRDAAAEAAHKRTLALLWGN